MSRFSFIHVADVHLDSGFSGLARLDAGIAAAFADAARRAFAGLVDLALARRVDFVAIAGDLYDGPWRDVGTAFFVRDQMRRLAEGGIPAFLVRGNHDSESEIAGVLPPEPNLTVFAAEAAETARLERLRVAIHGRSFPGRAVGEDFVRSYPPPVPGWFNLGLLHTSLDGRGGPRHAPYAPCTVGTLRAFGYDYWALGHVHAREVVSEDPPIVFPGCLQGRHARETGPKGAVLVEVEDGRVALDVATLDVARWETIALDLDGVGTEAERADAARRAFEAALDAAEGRPLIARLAWRGATPLDPALRRMSAEARLDDARALARDVSDRLAVEKTTLETTPPVAEDRAALGAIAETLGAAAADPALRAEVEAAIRDMAARLPREAGGAAEDEDGEDLLALDPERLIGEARRLLLARSGGEETA